MNQCWLIASAAIIMGVFIGVAIMSIISINDDPRDDDE